MFKCQELLFKRTVDESVIEKPYNEFTFIAQRGRPDEFELNLLFEKLCCGIEVPPFGLSLIRNDGCGY